MAYSDFTLAEVIETFNLETVEEIGIFNNVEEMEPTSLLSQTLTDHLSLIRIGESEKFKSEALVFPVLVDLKRQVGSLQLFSGRDFNVDKERKLNGRFDFLLTQSKEQLIIDKPVIIVVEAKKDDIGEGLGQCLATMVAAQIFNGLAKGSDTRPVMGTVTTGTTWVFMKLEGAIATFDLAEYSIRQPSKLLGILASAVI